MKEMLLELELMMKLKESNQNLSKKIMNSQSSLEEMEDTHE